VRKHVPTSAGLKCDWAPTRVALLFVLALSGCTTFKPPQISYDDEVPSLPDLPVTADDHPRPLHVPPTWTPARGGKKGETEAKDPSDRIEIANEVVRCSQTLLATDPQPPSARNALPFATPADHARPSAALRCTRRHRVAS
jgi:hypothetical protein